MDNELVFLVVPHVVRTQTLDPENLRTVDTGTGQAVELRYVDSADSDDSSSASAPARPGLPTPAAASSIGRALGEGTMAVAPAALAQLSAPVDGNGEAAKSLPSSHPSMASVSPSSPQTSEPGIVNLIFSPPVSPIVAGATFQAPVVLTGARDMASVPLQIQYDPAKLSLLNVTTGDLLNRDNQAVALVHLDDGPGSITIKAARPPGLPGISGAGVSASSVSGPKRQERHGFPSPEPWPSTAPRSSCCPRALVFEHERMRNVDRAYALSSAQFTR